VHDVRQGIDVGVLRVLCITTVPTSDRPIYMQIGGLNRMAGSAIGEELIGKGMMLSVQGFHGEL